MTEQAFTESNGRVNITGFSGLGVIETAGRLPQLPLLLLSRSVGSRVAYRLERPPKQQATGGDKAPPSSGFRISSRCRYRGRCRSRRDLDNDNDPNRRREPTERPNHNKGTDG